MDKDRLEGGVEGVAEPLGRKEKEMEGGTWQVQRGQGTHWGKAVSEEEGMGNWECLQCRTCIPIFTALSSRNVQFSPFIGCRGFRQNYFLLSWGVFRFCRDKFVV